MNNHYIAVPITIYETYPYCIVLDPFWLVSILYNICYMIIPFFFKRFLGLDE